MTALRSANATRRKSRRSLERRPDRQLEAVHELGQAHRGVRAFQWDSLAAHGHRALEAGGQPGVHDGPLLAACVDLGAHADRPRPAELDPTSVPQIETAALTTREGFHRGDRQLARGDEQRAVAQRDRAVMTMPAGGTAGRESQRQPRQPLRRLRGTRGRRTPPAAPSGTDHRCRTVEPEEFGAHVHRSELGDVRLVGHQHVTESVGVVRRPAGPAHRDRHPPALERGVVGGDHSRTRAERERGVCRQGDARPAGILARPTSRLRDRRVEVDREGAAGAGGEHELVVLSEHRQFEEQRTATDPQSGVGAGGSGRTQLTRGDPEAAWLQRIQALGGRTDGDVREGERGGPRRPHEAQHRYNAEQVEPDELAVLVLKRAQRSLDGSSGGPGGGGTHARVGRGVAASDEHRRPRRRGFIEHGSDLRMTGDQLRFVRHCSDRGVGARRSDDARPDRAQEVMPNKRKILAGGALARDQVAGQFGEMGERGQRRRRHASAINLQHQRISPSRLPPSNEGQYATS